MPRSVNGMIRPAIIGRQIANSTALAPSRAKAKCITACDNRFKEVIISVLTLLIVSLILLEWFYSTKATDAVPPICAVPALVQLELKFVVPPM